MPQKVSFAIDKTARGAAAAKDRVEEMGKAKGKVERASETVTRVERKGMWASIKHYSDPTAHQSLHLVACRADAHTLDKHAGVQAWTVALYSKLPSAKDIFALVTDSSVRPVKKWLHGFTEAGRAERTEQDWKDAVKRAHETHALHEHMEDLEASRERHDQATSSVVSSALGHRQSVEPERIVLPPPPSVSSAGSIFSNERVAFPLPVERPATEIIIPGLRQLKPTPPRSVDTSELEASSPTEIYQPHPIFRDPAHVNFAQLSDFSPRDRRSKDGDCFDLRYFPARDRDETFDLFNEITTSYSESLEDYPPMCRSELSLDIVDRMMAGDGDRMVLFGRWRHRKDAPLSQVKEMIERELRGPGACSLYGPGGLKTEDHPLVCLYNERLEKLKEEESSDLQEPKSPLSPTLLQGNSASQRSSLRSSTPITFTVTEDGTFKTTGFRMRSSSIGSTVESISPIGSSDFVTTNAQQEARRDSGVQGLQPEIFSEKVDSSLGNYEVLRYYSPDPALDYKAINDETVPEHCREQRPMVTEDYIRNVIYRWRNRSKRPPPRARLPPQQRPHAQNPQNFAHHGTPHPNAPQTPHGNNAGLIKLGHDLQRFHSRRYGQQEKRDSTAHQQNNALTTSQSQHQQPPISAQPHQAPEVMQQKKHVRLDESKNVSRIIPCPVTIVAPEDAENAMFSDEEDTVVDTQEAPNNNAATKTSPGSHRTMPMPRSILKTSSSYAAASTLSSAASAAAKDLNTSTELSPSHATPGTTASSGRECQIKSTVLARSMTRKLDERLKQIETNLSDKNC